MVAVSGRFVVPGRLKIIRSTENSGTDFTELWVLVVAMPKVQQTSISAPEKYLLNKIGNSLAEASLL